MIPAVAARSSLWTIAGGLQRHEELVPAQQRDAEMDIATISSDNGETLRVLDSLLDHPTATIWLHSRTPAPDRCVTSTHTSSDAEVLGLGVKLGLPRIIIKRGLERPARLRQLPCIGHPELGQFAFGQQDGDLLLP